jgi:hypothetical protein
MVRWVTEQGHVHVIDVGLRTADDRTVWDLAASMSAVIHPAHA